MKNVQMAPGIFKGMKVILEERPEFGDQICDLGRECPVSLPPDRTYCICRTLYLQPDFWAVTSLHGGKRDFEVFFLPEFRPELNFVEKCWGCARWDYRKLPASSREI